VTLSWAYPCLVGEADDATEITALLLAARDDREALDRAFAVVYGELRRLARWHLQAERSDSTLDTTALVHEAYLRLVGPTPVSLADRHHFFALAAKAMRQIVVDYARRRRARKRGGGAALLRLDEILTPGTAPDEELLALDEALDRLARLDERMSRIVEWRFFGGMSEEEIATALDISSRTVKREWRKARAFLFRELSEGETR
jgi:RNA polymerase sigma factor (TIGR02999 family)